MKKFIPLRPTMRDDIQWFLLLLEDGSFGLDWLGVDHGDPGTNLWHLVRDSRSPAVVDSWSFYAALNGGSIPDV